MTANGRSSRLSNDDPLLLWVAQKIGTDSKQMSKSLNKFIKAEDKLDSPSSFCGFAEKEQKTFGGSLEQLDFTRGTIIVGNKEISFHVPRFLLDVTRRILSSLDVVGLLRTPGNARRVTYAIDSINAGTPLDAIDELSPHDLCHLFKEWCRELPRSLIPDQLALYMFRVFDMMMCHELPANDKGNVLRYLGSFMSQRSRSVVVFLSEVLHCISLRAESNHMTAENLARVCPSIFTGEVDSQLKGPRAFEIPIALTEFLINNPHTFVEDLTPEAVLTAAKGKSCNFVDSSLRPATTLRASDIKPIIPQKPPVRFSAAFKPPSPNKRKPLNFDFRSPVQSMRTLMNMATGSRVRSKFGRIYLSHQRRLSQDRHQRQFSHSKLSQQGLNTDTQPPASPLDPDNIRPKDVVLSSPVVENDQMQERSNSIKSSGRGRRSLHRLSMSSTPLCGITAGDIPMTPEDMEISSPKRLDFTDMHEALNTVYCKLCGSREADSGLFKELEKPINKKAVVVENGTQFDPSDFEMYLLSQQKMAEKELSIEATTAPTVTENFVLPSLMGVGRNMSVIIPRGIVAERVHNFATVL